MIVANLAPVQPLAGGERKPHNYNAATLEFIPTAAGREPLLRNLFLKLTYLIRLKYFFPWLRRRISASQIFVGT